MNLSVVISCVNEEGNLGATIRSIRETAGNQVEIVVVDDCSSTKLNVHGADKVIHNRFRCGVGPSRHIGAEHASGEYILLTDCHMVFTHGWYEAAILKIRYHHEASPYRTVLCGTCLAIDVEHPDVTKPRAVYHGATFNFCGPDKANRMKTQVLEGVWLPEQPGESYEIPCLMGAIYFWPRQWFLELAPLKHLPIWGVDEQIMSLKAWLSGGEVRLTKAVRIGHKFRIQQQKPPFTIKTPWIYYNKLFAILTCLPPLYGESLITKLPRGTDLNAAWQMIKTDWRLVESEKLRNRHLFTREFTWFLERFQLNCPHGG